MSLRLLKKTENDTGYDGLVKTLRLESPGHLTGFSIQTVPSTLSEIGKKRKVPVPTIASLGHIHIRINTAKAKKQGLALLHYWCQSRCQSPQWLSNGRPRTTTRPIPPSLLSPQPASANTVRYLALWITRTKIPRLQGERSLPPPSRVHPVMAMADSLQRLRTLFRIGKIVPPLPKTCLLVPLLKTSRCGCQLPMRSSVRRSENVPQANTGIPPKKRARRYCRSSKNSPYSTPIPLPSLSRPLSLTKVSNCRVARRRGGIAIAIATYVESTRRNYQQLCYE